MNPLKYVRPNIQALTPYSTARDDFKGGDISVWLDANENPYPSGLNRYPDPHQKVLKEAIGRVKGVPTGRIFIGGAGSDEAIDLAFRIFCRPGIDNAVAIAPSYGVYSVSAAINDVELREVMLGEDFSLPTDRLLAAADTNTKLLWICSPNNPTGNAFPLDELSRLCDSFDGMVCIDEAYVDFSPYGSMLDRLDRHPNLIVLQTFSKAWGMASLRMGLAFAAPEIAEFFARVKYPYNVNGPTQRELLKRIGETDIHPQVEEIVNERRKLEKILPTLPHIIKVYHSDANFLLVKTDCPDNIYNYLTDNGVIVRNRNKVAGCEGCLRITVGTPDENRRLTELLTDYGRH